MLFKPDTELAEIQTFYLGIAAGERNHYLPAFFLASVSDNSWQAAVVAVRDESNSPVGLLYAKERKLFGFRTGLFFADATLGALMAAREEWSKQAFWVAVNTLLRARRVRGLRMLAPPSGYEVALLRALANERELQFHTAPTESHMRLALTETYEQFLELLGARTRRNFNYYRKRSRAAGHEYVETVALEEFAPAAWALEAEGSTGGNPDALRRSLKMFAAAERPLLVGLRSGEGELLSLVGGWHEENRAVIFMQLNSDKRHARFSLSLVVRTYLIENLIKQGVREIIWWSGVGEPISNYCTPVPTTWAYLDSPSVSWQLMRGLIHRFRDRFPARFQEIAEWVVPRPHAPVHASSQSATGGEPE